MVDSEIGKKKSSGIGHFISKTFQTVIFLSVLSVVGMMANFFLLISPAIGHAYLTYRKRKLRQAGVDQMPEGKTLWVRATIVGIFLTAAFLAPVRGCSYILAKLSGYEKFHEFLMVTSLNGFVDAWLGICGVCFAIFAGLMYWRQALRLKTQIENIPTATIRSAAMGIGEFKGIARQIPDKSQRLTEKIVNGREEKFAWAEENGDRDDPIIHYCYTPGSSRYSKVVEISSRFYLEDETARILVDPRRAESWEGKGHFLTHPTRHYFLQEEEQDNLIQVPVENYYVKKDDSTVRQLVSGDEVYVIGNVEENRDADPGAIGSERLILRPSTRLNLPDLMSSIMLGESKTLGSDIYDIFFLTDIQESDAREMLTRGLGSVWIWVVSWAAFSLPPILFNPTVVFGGHELYEGLKGLLGFL